MRLLLTIDKEGADPVEYVKNMLAARQKISGFGHRVYKTEDPRATHLRRMSEQLGKDAGQPKWYEMSRAIELYINKEKKLNANVDFYSASTYATLGIDIDLYTPDLRHEPDRRMGRARHRAARRQPPDPPARRIHRS